MQSDTYLVDTDSEDENSDYTSDSSGDLPKNNNIGVFYKYKGRDTRFVDQSLVKNYNDIHRNLFSKQLTSGELVIQSKTYQTTSSFNSSNYTATFDEVKHVIGFQLKSANIRVPQYNINTTNNQIKFKISGSETIHTITINPGSYTVTELADVLQITDGTKVQHVDRSDVLASLTGTYYNSTATGVLANTTGMKFKLVHSSQIKFLWNHSNVTKGAAKLFGFYPVESDSFATDHYSDKPPDLSQHYVDLVIPEIPGIACKRSIFNGGRLDIVARIHLTEPRGEYVCYKPDNYVVNYFTPIRLSQLTIQLYSDNNVEFDSQNTDNDFVFEVTVLGP